MIHRSAGRLADGREIIFFDRAETRRDIQDPRDLPAVHTTSELRHDPILDEWVVMASHRQDRTYHPPVEKCPLCPSSPDRPTEIPAGSYDVVVFENRFPSLAGRGRCEVVCFTSDHTASFADLEPDHARLVVEAWADRTVELSRRPDVEQVFCFENRGKEIGVTLSHSHGQIYAYPFVTPRTTRMLDSARLHRAATGGNLFADVLAAERKDGVRVIAESAHWTAFVPAAARWPVELHLYPRRQVPDIPSLDEAERSDFVGVYLDVLRRLDRLYQRPLPYVAAWHQAPVRTDRELAYLHLQVFSIRRAPDKLKYLGGSESGMGAFITDVLPEDVANRLREVA